MSTAIQQLGGGAVNFSLSGTTVTGTGIGTMWLQKRSHRKTAESDEIKDQSGNLANKTFFNKQEEATLSYIVKGATLADAITQSTLPDKGTIVTITDSNYAAFAGTTWWVDGDPESETDMDGCMTITLQLKKAAGITAQINT